MKSSKKRTRRIVALVVALFATLVRPSECAFAAGQSDNAVINNFIARQQRIARATEYEEARSIVRGDLDADGDEDTAVLYTLEGFRGTNQYVQYLAVFINRRGRLVYFTHQAAGGKNRRAVDSVAIANGRINLQTQEYLPTDPSCCPSKKGHMSLILRRGRLRVV